MLLDPAATVLESGDEADSRPARINAIDMDRLPLTRVQVEIMPELRYKTDDMRLEDILVCIVAVTWR